MIVDCQSSASHECVQMSEDVICEGPKRLVHLCSTLTCSAGLDASRFHIYLFIGFWMMSIAFLSSAVIGLILPTKIFFLSVHTDTFQSLLLRRCWMSGDHSSVPLMSPCKEQSATLSSFYPQLCHQSCTTRGSSKKLIRTRSEQAQFLQWEVSFSSSFLRAVCILHTATVLWAPCSEFSINSSCLASSSACSPSWLLTWNCFVQLSDRASEK